MYKKLLFLSFIEGAVVMAAELCGAKLLAPIFGSSLYVWTSVMAITLVALAAGYFFGGYLSVQQEKLSVKLVRVLNAAALLVLLMPVLSHYLVPRISYLPFLPAVVFSAIVLLFFPIFFLGSSSPLLIALQSGQTNSGRVSGTVYAVSTFGGICATFLCGFYFIPSLGLNACLIGFGLSLFLSNLLVQKVIRPFFLLILCAVSYLNYQFTESKTGQLFVSDSLLGHLEVEDFGNSAHQPVRILKINNIIQTEMNLLTKKSMSDYVGLLDTLIPTARKGGQALVLGLGGGLTANALVKKKYRVEGVELDDRIIQAARSYFFLDKTVSVFEADARYFLNQCRKTYDVVLIDIFKAEEQPSHVLTLESLQQLKGNLRPGSRIYVNWHGYLDGDYGRGTAVLIHTLEAAGFHLKACSVSEDQDHRNIIFVACLSPLPSLPFERSYPPESFDLAELNSDDHPVLERENARANKRWRSNYLRYYQGKAN